MSTAEQESEEGEARGSFLGEEGGKGVGLLLDDQVGE